MSSGYQLPNMNSFKTITNNSPIIKITLGLMFPFMFGFIINYLPFNTYTKLIIYTIFIVSGIGITMYNLKIYNVKMAVFLSLLVGSLFWYYIFINKYREEKKTEKIGRKEFICNPFGKCKEDGTSGPYNGLEKYEYNPPSKPYSKDIKIPSSEFDVRIPTQMTYMFWLKIDYNNWKSDKFYNKYKTILLKGNDFNSGDLVVYALPKEDSIQFNINTNSTNSTSEFHTKFPFDKWVHYTVTVKDNVAELYTNATLDKSIILNGNINLSKTPLYIGKYIGDSLNMPDNFPGQMLYLTYINRNLTPGEIYSIYEKEFNIMSNMSDDLNDINQDKNGDSNSNNCENRCQSSSQGNQCSPNQQSPQNSSKQNNNHQQQSLQNSSKQNNNHQQQSLQNSSKQNNQQTSSQLSLENDLYSIPHL